MLLATCCMKTGKFESKVSTRTFLVVQTVSLTVFLQTFVSPLITTVMFLVIHLSYDIVSFSLYSQQSIFLSLQREHFLSRHATLSVLLQHNDFSRAVDDLNVIIFALRNAPIMRMLLVCMEHKQVYLEEALGKRTQKGRYLRKVSYEIVLLIFELKSLCKFKRESFKNRICFLTLFRVIVSFFPEVNLLCSSWIRKSRIAFFVFKSLVLGFFVSFFFVK